MNPKDEASLNPCPFCGSNARLTSGGVEDPRKFVECVDKFCFAEGPRKVTQLEAVTRWNERRDQTLIAKAREEAAKMPVSEAVKCQDRFTDFRAITPLQAVKVERGWQDGMFGISNHSDGVWLALLAEEFGEAANAMNVAQFEEERREAALDNLEVELIQVAATAVAWVEALRRRRVLSTHPASGEGK